jgi:hypothetical protein
VKAVWSILADGFSNRLKWVLIGSPEKSALTVLLSFYLAQKLNMSVILVRKLKAHEQASQSGWVVIGIRPNGQAVGYNTQLCQSEYSTSYILTRFEVAHCLESYESLLIMDEFSQLDLSTNFMSKVYGGCDLLTTSSLYYQTNSDTHQIVYLPLPSSWAKTDHR